MQREGFIIYKSFYEPLKILSDEQLGKLFRAIFEYQINNVEDVNPDIKMAFEFFKNQFRLDNDKYQKIIERNKINGSKGGRPKTQENQKNPMGLKEPKKADKEKDKEKDKDNKKEINKEKRFKKPTLEEVAEYCKERDNLINPETFINYYEANGWKVGKNPMKDWKACIRSWETKEYNKQPKERLPKWFNQDIKKQKNENEEELKDMLKEFN